MKTITSEQYEKEVLKGGKVALDFYSTECPPCEALAPKFDSLSELYDKDVKFIKIFRQENRELAERLGVKSSPTVLFYDNGEIVGEILSGGIKKSELITNLDILVGEKRADEIKAKIIPSTTEYDTLILGGGPGGLAAGLYLCQAKVKAALVDINLPGGQVATTHQVSNYPGFIEPQPGYMLSHFMSEQTKICGTKYKVAVDVTHVDLENKTVLIDNYETLKAKKIVIATGASPRLIGIPGEREYKGKGISYCATCDAKYFEGKDVVVIGGGNTAVEESLFIAKFAKNITVVHQFDKLTANKEAQQKAFDNPKINFLLSHEPRAFEKEGDKMVVKVEDLKTKESKELTSDGIFIFIGMSPNTSLLGDKIEKDDWGYIKTNEDMKTNIDGIFAIGDVRSKKYRQITTAVADGTIAAIALTKEIDD
jgi:thioredoxin reductase (NADPH)